VYDLRAINTKNPVQLNYKANVMQATGENWNNVKLKLSTANPNQSGLKPEILAWYLNFDMPVYRYSMSAGAGQSRKAKVASDRAEDEEKPSMVMAEAAQTLNEYVSTVQTTLNTEFDISLPYTVASLLEADDG